MKFKIIRPNDTIEVLLMKHKLEDKWSFVNLTKGHICPCKFSSIEEALIDLESYMEKGKILKYYIEKNVG